MKREVKDAIRTCVVQILKACKENYVESIRHSLAYKVTAPNGWYTEEVEIKFLYETLRKVGIVKYTKPVEEFFLENYPEFRGHFGLAVEGGTGVFMFGSVIYELVETYWGKYGTLEIIEEKLELLISDFEYFVDNEEVEVNVITPLEYLSSDIFLPTIKVGDVNIRRFSDKEITAYLFGGRIINHQIPNYCLEYSCRTKKIFKATDSTGIKLIIEKMEFVLDTLRTFKAGSIGRGTVFVRPNRYVPLVGGFSQLNVKSLNWTGFSLCEMEVEDFKEHSKLLMDVTDKSLSLAYRWLSNSEIGRDEQDSFLDAMIGLEAILAPENAPEISFRLSMRYASLFDNPKDRLEKYNIARKLYRLRNDIVHGNVIDNKFEGKSINYWDKTAREMLRLLVKKFIRETPRLSKDEKNEYWKRKTLRIPEELKSEGEN